MIKNFLKIEALFLWIACIFFYWTIKQNWIIYALGLLVPDISMLGYLISKRVGAVIYNIFHVYIWSVILIIIGVLNSNNLILGIGLIYASHISMDRVAGYGLKYLSDFNDNHLSKV